MGIRGSFLICCAVAARLAWAADYFPLAPGNAWVYRLSRGPVQGVETVEVEDTAAFGGRVYYRVRWFHGRTAYLRPEGDRALYSYDPATGRESLWYQFDAGQGQSFATTVDECSPTATVASRSGRLATPVREFDNTLTFTFQVSCADAGITSQVFAPGAGLIEHTETSISGPRQYELVYARAGADLYETPKAGFSLAIDRIVYRLTTAITGTKLYARMTLSNGAGSPLTLTFPTGQTYEILIRNQKGEIVLRWSDPLKFTQALREVALPPGETNWAEMLDLGRLAPGSYSAEVYLTTIGTTAEEPRPYAASVGFEIVDAR